MFILPEQGCFLIDGHDLKRYPTPIKREDNRELDLPLDLSLSASVSALAKAYPSGDAKTREDTPTVEPSSFLKLVTQPQFPPPRASIESLPVLKLEAILILQTWKLKSK